MVMVAVLITVPAMVVIAVEIPVAEVITVAIPSPVWKLAYLNIAIAAYSNHHIVVAHLEIRRCNDSGTTPKSASAADHSHGVHSITKLAQIEGIAVIIKSVTVYHYRVMAIII